VGGGGDQEAAAQGGDLSGPAGKALRQMNAVGAQAHRKAPIRADQKDQPAPARRAGKVEALRHRVARPVGAKDHPRSTRQTGDHPPGARRAMGVGEEQQGRQTLSRPRPSP